MNYMFKYIKLPGGVIYYQWEENGETKENAMQTLAFKNMVKRLGRYKDITFEEIECDGAIMVLCCKI